MCKPGGQGRWDAADGGQLETEVSQEQTTLIKGYPRLLLAYFLLTLLHFGVKKTLELPREYPTMDRFLSIRICCCDLAPFSLI